jgi:hypothetical protein
MTVFNYLQIAWIVTFHMLLLGLVILLSEYIMLMMILLLGIDDLVTLIPRMVSSIILYVHHRLHMFILISCLIHATTVVIIVWFR